MNESDAAIFGKAGLPPGPAPEFNMHGIYAVGSASIIIGSIGDDCLSYCMHRPLPAP